MTLEIAIRFKHRANGNGKHSRPIADVIVEKIFKQDVFTWGSTDLIQGSKFRSSYLQALRTADNGNYGPLHKFARS